MISKYITEVGYLSYNHAGEQLCGDHIEVIHPNDDTAILVLADGLGSGVKANILSTLTAKMLSTMIAKNVSIKECVDTIAETLPVCKERCIAYSTFTIIKVENNRLVEIYNYDNPMPFVISNGKSKDLDWTLKIVDDKKVYHTKLEANLYDTFVLFSDGVVHAGIGETLNFGWDIPQIKDFLQGLYQKSYSSMSLATSLVDYCNELYNHRPGDDTTAAVVRIRERSQVNLLIGPASNKDDDEKMLSLFFAKGGKHIVSGGTTSNIVSKYLHKPLDLALDYIDKEIPPTASIEGVDLVTEGVITINRVLDYAKDMLQGKNHSYFDWSYKRDGASQIAKLLFEEATDINFFVGCAINNAHQSDDVHLSFSLKMQLIDELAKMLKLMGKNIKVSYF